MSAYATTGPSAVLAWAALLFFGVLILPRLGYLMWRPWHYGERPKNYGKSYSEAGWVDFQRIGPTTVICLAFAVIAADVDYFFGLGTPFLKLVVYGSAILAAAAGVLTISVHFLRWPQWCIAPVLREPKRPRRRPRPRRD
jgi:hypothetical protein